MAAPNTSPVDYALVESAIQGDRNDHRVLLQNILDRLAGVETATGQTGQNTKNVAAPPQGSIQVNGANGNLSYAITPGASSNPATIYHRVSYAPGKTFSNGVKSLPWSTATSGVIPEPGFTGYVRLESSYNKVVANQPVLHGQSPVSAGLISSAAMADGAAFAQTNLMTVTSSQGSGSAEITIQGAGGTLTSGVRLKGGVQSILPPAMISGNPLGANVFVGWDGKNYQPKDTLGAVLLDNLAPVGKVTVAGTGNASQDGGGGVNAGNGGRLTAV